MQEGMLMCEEVKSQAAPLTEMVPSPLACLRVAAMTLDKSPGFCCPSGFHWPS